jgi:hypothetical protein
MEDGALPSEILPLCIPVDPKEIEKKDKTNGSFF